MTEREEQIRKTLDDLLKLLVGIALHYQNTKTADERKTIEPFDRIPEREVRCFS